MLKQMYKAIVHWSLGTHTIEYEVPPHIRTIFELYDIKTVSDQQLSLNANQSSQQDTDIKDISQKDCQYSLINLYKKPIVANSWYIKVPQLMKSMCDHANAINFNKLNADLLRPVLQFILISNHPKVTFLREQLFFHLAQSGYTKVHDNLYPLFKTAFKANKSRALKELLSHEKLIPPDKLLSYAHKFLDTDRDDAFAFDLFPKLNPEYYRQKKWRNLTSYERLYWLVYDEFQMTALSHRMGLEGTVTYNWHGYSRSNLSLKPSKPKQRELDIEGNFNDIALIHFKSSLLMYISHAKQMEADTHILVSRAVESIVQLFPLIDSQYRYKLNDKQKHLFYYSLEDDHATAGYHCGNLYYQINMGHGCHDKPGIQVFDVPEPKRALTHGFLCNTQYNHKTKHFNKIPKRCGLVLKYTLMLPEQLVGNCTYESLKGLFAAIVFDELLKNHAPVDAYRLSMDIYRSFCEFDINDAIVDYREHALSINKDLMTIAYDSKERCLKKMVFKDSAFVFHQDDEEPIEHHYTPMTKANRVSVC